MMGRKHPSFAISLTVSLFVVLSLSMGLQGHAASTPVTDALVINEIDYDQPSTDTAELIEIKNISGSSVNLDSYQLDLVNGTGGGATVWHINADEPRILDYNEEYNPPHLYSPDAYRSSDHGPVLVHLDLGARKVLLPLVARDHDSLQADLIFHNGTVLTMEGESWDAEAIAIRGDKILLVGNESDVLALQGPGTKVVDLGGCTLMPGFVDAHTHTFNDAWYWELDLAGAQQLALGNGITTLADMYVPPEFLDEMQTFAADGELVIRTSLYLVYDTPCGDVLGDWYLAHPPTHGFGEKLRIGGVKIFSDGGVCGKPAISFDYPEKYSGGQGDLWLSQEELQEVIAQAHSAGYQVVIHAVGDRANETVQNAYKSVLGSQPNTSRHRIEHSTVVRPDLLTRYSDTGLVAALFGHSPTCSYLTGEGWPEILGPGRLSWLRPYRAILDMNPGQRFTWHGDDPWVGPVSPILELYGAVTRKEIDADGTTICEPPAWLAATALTVEEALPMMTIEAAYAIFREQEVGSLKPGKFADVVILSDNPLTVEPDAIKDIELVMTMVGGGVEYCAEGQEVLCPGYP